MNNGVKREIVQKEEGQGIVVYLSILYVTRSKILSFIITFDFSCTAYAQVTKMLGSCFLEAMCLHDNQKRLCHIRGQLRKRVRIFPSDIILIGLKDYQDEKADVILKYSAYEARQLAYRKEISFNLLRDRPNAINTRRKFIIELDRESDRESGCDTKSRAIFLDFLGADSNHINRTKMHKSMKQRKRARNVVVFGLKESISSKRSVKQADDKLVVEKMFEMLNVSAMTIRNVKRLKSAIGEIGPILIELDDKSNARLTVLNHYEQLKHIPMYKDVFIRPDLAASQR